MDAKYLTEIKLREQAATPGPWYADGWALWDDDHGEFVELHDTDPDAQFIAHAREDIPALIAEVEKSGREIATLKKALITEIRDSHTDLSPASHQKLFDHYVQQAQEGKE